MILGLQCKDNKQFVIIQIFRLLFIKKIGATAPEGGRALCPCRRAMTVFSFGDLGGMDLLHVISDKLVGEVLKFEGYRMEGVAEGLQLILGELAWLAVLYLVGELLAEPAARLAEEPFGYIGAVNHPQQVRPLNKFQLRQHRVVRVIFHFSLVF